MIHQVYGAAYIIEMKNFGEALKHILILGIMTSLIHTLIHIWYKMNSYWLGEWTGGVCWCLSPTEES